MAQIEWTLRIKKGSTFRLPVTVKDKAGNLVPFTNTEFLIKPDNGEATISLTPANGKLTIPGTGLFLFLIPAAETANYNFEKGEYCWHVTRPNGDVDKEYRSGVVRIEKCL